MREKKATEIAEYIVQFIDDNYVSLSVFAKLDIIDAIETKLIFGKSRRCKYKE